MGAILANTSWLATILGLILCMGLGFFWYNPKFPTGKIWAEGAGVSPDAPDDFPALAMGLNTLGLFLAAILIGAVPVGLIHIGYWLVGMVLVLIANAIF